MLNMRCSNDNTEFCAKEDSNNDDDDVDNEELWYVCTSCYAAFQTEKSIRRHRKSAHSTVNPKWLILIKSDLNPIIALYRCCRMRRRSEAVEIKNPENVLPKSNVPLKFESSTLLLPTNTDDNEAAGGILCYGSNVVALSCVNQKDVSNYLNLVPQLILKRVILPPPSSSPKQFKADVELLVPNQLEVKQELSYPNPQDEEEEEMVWKIPDLQLQLKPSSSTKEETIYYISNPPGDVNGEMMHSKILHNQAKVKEKVTDEAEERDVFSSLKVERVESNMNSTQNKELTEDDERECGVAVEEQFDVQVSGCVSEPHHESGRNTPPEEARRRKPVKCHKCPASFQTTTGLKLHLQRHNLTPKFTCLDCDYKTKIKCNLERHIRVMHNPDCKPKKPRRIPNIKYECPHCAQLFTAKGNMERHIRETHHIGLPTSHMKINNPAGLIPKHKKYKREFYSCLFCPCKYTNWVELTRHMRKFRTSSKNKSPPPPEEEEEEEEKTTNEKLQALQPISEAKDHGFTCPLCSDRLENLDCFNEHILSTHPPSESQHNGNRCRHCGKTFSALRYLNDHVEMIHNWNPINNHTCDTCGAQFKTAYRLKCHLKAHDSDNLLYKCTQCDRSFKQK